MALYILRGVFLVLVTAVTALYLLPNQWGAGLQFWQFVVALLLTVGVATIVITVDVTSKRKRLSSLSGVFLGLIAGLLAAYALSFVVDLIGLLARPRDPETQQVFFNLLEGVKVLIGLLTCYLSISLVMQTKDDFRFVIPYVEFAKEVRGTRPTVLDTSVIIDGRILDVVQTHIVQGTLIVPRFIINELQTIADSADRIRRARGRRGLDILNKLQDDPAIEILIDETEPAGPTVDQRLINLVPVLQARLMTNDFNLAKVADLRGIEVVNLNELAKAMRPVVLPGEAMQVKIVKPGEGASQGVGYLDDGTMVVVENARQMIGEEVELTVTSTLQTSAGRMIFGRYVGGGQDGGERDRPRQHHDDTGADREAESRSGEGGTKGSESRPRSGSSGRNPRRSGR
jgi:uncharacterized protein YacL